MREQYPFYSYQRVHYSDLDGQAIVFYANYLTFIDIALNQFIRASNIDYKEWALSADLDFHVVNVSLQYLNPLQVGDELEVGVAVTRIGRSSLNWEVAMFRAHEAEPAARGDLVWVCANQSTHRSAPIPDDVRAAFLTLGGRT